MTIKIKALVSTKLFLVLALAGDLLCNLLQTRKHSLRKAAYAVDLTYTGLVYKYLTFLSLSLYIYKYILCIYVKYNVHVLHQKE